MDASRGRHPRSPRHWGLGGDVRARLEAGAGPARRPAPRGGGMTTQHWRWIDGLFAGAIRIDPAGRAPWLRRGCGYEGPPAQAGHILDDDERAERQWVLRPQETPDRGLKATAARPAPACRSGAGQIET